MAKIQFIPSINEEFATKNCKIWFCAHPDDYPIYLKSITADLFEAINCSVYYDAEPKADYDEETLLSDLRFMNLFVMPVTSRLLREPNRALDVEFKYAMENGIRVLPLIQESEDLVKTFNEVCGTLHCLKAFGQYKETGTYQNELKKQLEKMFANDFLNKQILDEFDASIFLSYRKIDREYMLSLIHMIHESEGCRDIAVWYDDFLTPGENFNAEIQKALESSDAFVLAITPHILDKNAQGKRNYVIEEEYPRAKNANKKILPIRMAPLSQKKLEHGFRQHSMPEYVNAHNSAMLSQALKATLSHASPGKSKETPHHAYLIGLAYLRGLNGEIDRDRALSLIEKSANHGHIPAIEQLVSMYNNGDGVPVDFAKSLEWQRKLVERRKQKYNRNSTQGNLIMLSYSVFDLIKRLLKEEIVNELEQLLGLAENFFQKVPSGYMAKGVAARCCMELARYHYGHLECGDRNKAEQYLVRACTLFEESIQEEEADMASIDQDEDDMTCADTDEEHEDYADPDALNGLAQVYELMSEMGVRRGADDCVDYSKEAAEIMERLIEITKRREDPQFLTALRIRSAKHQSYREQENTYLSALELFRGLSKKAPTVENKRELIGALCNLSNFRMLQSWHGKNEHIPSVLAKGRAEIVAKKYGSDYQIPSELDLILDADALSREAFSLCEEVAVLTGEANDLRMIVNLCDQIGHITERLAEASRFDSSYMERYLATAQSSLTYYDRAANASERLVKITDRVGDYELLAFVLENRSTLYIKAGGKQNTEKALEDDLRLIDVYQYMYDKTENPQYLKKINFKCYAVSELYDGLGDAERAAYFKGKTSYDPFG